MKNPRDTNEYDKAICYLRSAGTAMIRAAIGYGGGMDITPDCFPDIEQGLAVLKLSERLNAEVTR